MTLSRTLARCLVTGAILSCSAGAFAQTPAPAADASKSGVMASDKAKLSKDEQATLKRCKGMSHDAMMGDEKCKTLLDAHPTLAPQDKSMSVSKPK